MQSVAVQNLLYSINIQRLRPLVVDVGASDGLYTSNSYDLIVQYGWSALLIDPQEDKLALAQQLHQDRLDHVRFLPFALAESTCTAMLFGHYNDGDGYTTLNHGASLIQDIESSASRPVQVMGYDDFLKLVNLDDVGIFAIDAEGYDYNILYGLLTRTAARPQVIITEREYNIVKEERPMKERFLSQWYDMIYDQDDQVYILKIF